MFLKCVFLLSFFLGIFLLMQVVMPFIAFKGWEIFLLDQNSILADPNPQSAGDFDSDISIQDIGNFPAFISRDKSLPPPAYQSFKLTIPKISLTDSRVNVNSNNFEDSLAHLPGTALPGEKGNVFITGHSSLSAISLLESSVRKPIFVNLSSLKKGDQVFLDVGGQRYVYDIIGMKIVDPKETSVLNPPDMEGRYVTLMTCVPPGFNTRRLIVLAKLKGD